MIYSASRRTDLPAFFPDFLAEKVRRSRKLEALVFWTKDVRNLVRHPGLARAAEKTPCLVQFTVTGLAGSAWEPGAPTLAEQREELAELSRRLPPGALLWRFDPILPVPEGRRDGPLARFRRIRELWEKTAGGLDGVTVSFPDPYPGAVARVRARGLSWPVFPPAERRRILADLAGELSRGGGVLRLCCEPDLLGVSGAVKAVCVDGARLERLYGPPLGALPKDPGQRAACGCVKSVDIGSYGQVCGHGCLYCYARPAPAAGAELGGELKEPLHGGDENG